MDVISSAARTMRVARLVLPVVVTLLPDASVPLDRDLLT
jgi:hypothetical protein